MIHRIILKQHYSGRFTNETLIEPGTYEVGDPRLFGLEHYLVNEQHIAVFIGEPPPPPPPPQEPPGSPISEPTTPQALVQQPSHPPQEPAEPPVIVAPPPAYADTDMDILRAFVAKRGLTEKVVPTGKNGIAKKADLILALETADAADAPPAPTPTE